MRSPPAGTRTLTRSRAVRRKPQPPVCWESMSRVPSLNSTRVRAAACSSASLASAPVTSTVVWSVSVATISASPLAKRRTRLIGPGVWNSYMIGLLEGVSGLGEPGDAATAPGWRGRHRETGAGGGLLDGGGDGADQPGVDRDAFAAGRLLDLFLERLGQPEGDAGQVAGVGRRWRRGSRRRRRGGRGGGGGGGGAEGGFQAAGA